MRFLKPHRFVEQPNSTLFVLKNLSRFAKLSALIALTAFVPHSNVKNTEGVVFSEKNNPQLPEAAASCSEVNNTTFNAGEELTYKIFYNLNFVWIPAGEVVFKIEDEGSRYHLSAVGRTYDSYDWFFKVRDYYNSYVDKQTLLPQTSIRYVNESKYKLYDMVNFDQKSRKATYERGKAKETIDKRGSIDLTDCMHDVLSIVYYSRTLDYSKAEIGQEFPVKVMLDEEAYDLKYKLLARETKSVHGLGNFATMRFSPQVVAGNVFNEKTQMKIWASDDQNRLPLMIESPVSVGSVKVVLKSWKGLKYDMAAKKN